MPKARQKKKTKTIGSEINKKTKIAFVFLYFRSKTGSFYITKFKPFEEALQLPPWFFLLIKNVCFAPYKRIEGNDRISPFFPLSKL